MSVLSSLPLLLFLLGCVNNGFVIVNSFVLPVSSSSSHLASKNAFSLAASPLADDALACYPYQFRTKNDNDDSSRRALFEITETQARKAFEEIAKLYGDESALDMVKIQPLALATNPNYFEPTLQIWVDAFGLEMAQGMVQRNPALLLINPELAKQDALGAMGASYVIWATRPLISKLAIIGYAFYQYDSVVSAGDDFFPWKYHIEDTGSGISIIADSLNLW